MREMRGSDGFEASIGGGLYGLILCILGLLAAGGGHGTYLPMAVFGAPFAAVLGPLGLVACLAWWPIVGFALGASRRPGLPATLLGVHAIAALAVFLLGTPWEMGSYGQAQSHMWPVMFSGWVVYVIGQAAAWSLVVVRWLVPEDTVDG